MSIRTMLPIFLLTLTMVPPGGGLAAGVDAAVNDDDRPSLWAVKFEVPDPSSAARFYNDALGFSDTGREPVPEAVLMVNGPFHLLLARSDAPRDAAGAAHLVLNMSVGDLDAVVRAVVAAGGRGPGGEVRTSAVGLYHEVHDPAGNTVHIIDHPWDDMARDDIPVVFNVGLHVLDVAASEAFLTDLGFRVETRDYLPDTLVFAQQGAAYLVAHPLATSPADAGAAIGSLLVVDAGGDSRKLHGPSGLAVEMAPGETRLAGTSPPER